jgi:hypothetical protein
MVKVLNEKQAERKLDKKQVNYSDLIEYLFPVNILEKYADKLEGHWWRVSKYQRLTEDFMRTFAGRLNWEMVSQYQSLSESFIVEFKDKVDWLLVSQYQRLSERFIGEFSNQVSWESVSEYQKLSEDFMIQWKKNVVWSKVSQFQKMSLEFMEEMWSKLDRKKISEYQELTEQFVWKRYDKISEMSLDKIIKRVKLSESFLTYVLQNMRGYTPQYVNVCLQNIVVYQKLSKEFCVRYANHLPLDKLVYNKCITREEREQLLTTVKIIAKLA